MENKVTKIFDKISLLVLSFFIVANNISFADSNVVVPKQIKYIQSNSTKLAIPAVTMQTSGYLNQVQSYQQAFKNMDNYMLLKKEDRVELRKQRREQLDLNDKGIVTPRKRIVDISKDIWFRPYTDIEKIGFNNGPDVSNIDYGSYFGFDTEMFEFGNDWSGNVGFYAAYNGSHQSYDDIGIYMNGGSIGTVGTIYKGNAYAGVTVSAGAHTGTASSGDKDYDIFVIASGVGAKTGYNFEIKNGSVIVQPNFAISYTYVESFDYQVGTGYTVYPGNLHALHLEPGLNLVWNLNSGWQPFANVSFIWNLLDETNVKLATYKLPQLSINPYVKYGLGIRKRWNNRFSLSQQTYVYNGGINGVGFNLDCKMAVGKK